MKNTIIALIILIMMMSATSVLAAMGCTLTDPDRDIIRIFPEATNYRTQFITIEERGGEALYKEVEERLGGSLDPVYETSDVPYAYYTVLKGREPIGYVHGVNQKGMFGGMQLILATDLEGVVVDFYYQKIASPEAKKFRDTAFTRQFHGSSLKDFYNVKTGFLNSIQDPSQNSADDFKATLRGLKKNLILHDKFILQNKYDAYF